MRLQPRKHFRRAEALLIALGFVLVVGFILGAMVLSAGDQLRATHRKQAVDSSLTAAKNSIGSMAESVVWIVNNRPPQLNGAIDAINEFVRSIEAPPQPGIDIVSSYVDDWQGAANDFEWNEITDPNDYWYGYTTTRLDYEVVALARDNTVAPVATGAFPGVAMRRRITIDYVPMWAYWALTGSNVDPFELHPGPDMTVRGRVHSNADMRLASRNNLWIYGEVTSVGRFLYGAGEDWTFNGNVRMASASQLAQERQTPGTVSANSLPNIKGASSLSDHPSPNSGNWLDALDPEWVARSNNLWQGSVKDAASGIRPVNPPLPEGTDALGMIQRVSPSDTDAERAVKFEANADLKILGDPAADPATWYAEDSSGNRLPLTYQVPDGQGGFTQKSVARPTTFTDRRENKTVRTLTVDMGNLLEWQTAQDTNGNPINFSFDSGVLYVSTENNGGATLNSVQIVNASRVPNSFGNKGLTVATDRPLYTVGAINTVDKKTLMLAADAVTVLSKEFNASTGNRPKADSTITNMVLLFGTVPTAGDPQNPNSYVQNTTQQSGGLHNSMRYLEDWGSRTHTHNGSLLVLFRSALATGKWSTAYYVPPTRSYNWDESLRNLEPPPGMPTFIFVTEGDWEQIDPTDVAGWPGSLVI